MHFVVAEWLSFNNLLLLTITKQLKLPSLDRANCTEIIETKPRIPSETLRKNSAWKDEGIDEKYQAHTVTEIHLDSRRFVQMQFPSSRITFSGISLMIHAIWKKVSSQLSVGNTGLNRNMSPTADLSEPLICHYLLWLYERRIELAEFPKIYLTI